MRIRTGCCLALIFACCTGNAQPVKSSSLLWEIRGNGIERPSYIFGTFHLMCKGDFAVTDKLGDRISAASRFYGELKMDDPGMQMKMMKLMIMPERSLKSMIADSDYERVNSRFTNISGVPFTLMDHMRPFLAASLLAIKSTPCEDVVQPETEMMNYATGKKLQVLGLETVEEQLAAIDREPLDSQVADLVRTVLNFDSVKNASVQLLNVYKKRNIDTLYSFMKKTGISEDMELALLNERNRKWVPLIEKAMHEQPSFFAVGAGHLGGPAGVINLLRKRGYNVRPISY